MRLSFLSTSHGGPGDAHHVPTYREMQAPLVAELRRARRYEYPLSVVTLGPFPMHGGAGGDAPHGPALYGLLGDYLRNTLRESDVLAGLPEHLGYALVLPGVPGEGAGLALHRVQAGFVDCAGVELRGGVAVFPADGLTLDDLLDCACAAWRRSCLQPEAGRQPEARRSHG